jgi:hypothetical protein
MSFREMARSEPDRRIALSLATCRSRPKECKLVRRFHTFLLSQSGFAPVSVTVPSGLALEETNTEVGERVSGIHCKQCVKGTSYGVATTTGPLTVAVHVHQPDEPPVAP